MQPILAPILAGLASLSSEKIFYLMIRYIISYEIVYHDQPKKCSPAPTTK